MTHITDEVQQAIDYSQWIYGNGFIQNEDGEWFTQVTRYAGRSYDDEQLFELFKQSNQ